MHRIFAGLAFWTTAAIVAEFVIGTLLSGAIAGRRAPEAQSLFTWHMLLGIGVGTIVCVLHIMTMFHFIGSGKEIKEHAAVLGENAEIIRKLRRFKMHVFPWATFAPLVTGLAVILGGGAHMKSLPPWVHVMVGAAALAMNLVAFPIEYRTLKLNLDLIGEVDRCVRRQIAPAPFRDDAEVAGKPS